MFFPVRHMSTLYGIVNLPQVVLMWLNEPLYRLILNGPDIADAQFCPVAIGFSVLCAFCMLSVLYIFIVGRKIKVVPTVSIYRRTSVLSIKPAN